MSERFEAHWILSPQSAPIAGGQVSFDRESGHIESVLPLPHLDLDLPGGTLFLTPGLVNAHTHLELGQDQPIPIGPGQSMADWLEAASGSKKGMDETDLVRVCQKHIMELIRTGTTCVNDITTDGASAIALAKVGMRGIVSPEFFNPVHTPDPEVSGDISRFHRLKDQYASHPLIEIGISPHSPYNVTPQAWEKVMTHTDPFLVHTHLAENQAEIDYFRHGTSAIDQVHERILGRRFGPVRSDCTPVEAIADLLHDRTVAVHGVYLTESDMAILKEKGVGLVHCPRSNAWLSGPEVKMPLLEIYHAGLPIGLGTDSRLSNHDLDMRNEGRASRALYGYSAKDTFDFMTHCSADILGLGDRIGKLNPGYDADMVLWWNPTDPADITDPYETWLSPQTEAVTVWIHGRIVLERAGVLGD